MSSSRLLKTILLGSSNVGKTALIHRFVNQKFTNSYKATIGADFMTKSITVEGKEVTMQTWDTAGNERFISLSIAFYRGADCCGLVFDVSNPKSFEQLTMWKNEFLKNCTTNKNGKFPFVIIGNKIDKGSVISKEAVTDWIQFNGLDAIYVESSALTGDNVDFVFECLAKKALESEPLLVQPNETLVQPFKNDDEVEQAPCC
ncbi:hypothetical protein, conserved [Entamoeba dispar SAW760]|uniref:Uncharacterized protein n=1 Tax=Entamoeba dispar (strain ATCC PRA-260 / SAW760) TaxID=370354 RepID=B0EGF6_ENTDS|nr:uncharacterized protein EDI_078620 [Entamoeba dispar SAW760]EDR26390.1 hypothetical protein, conserved [Entamoeba dispar SAW760]|eukprot:EDR26390.1 hypothetical protein, conserved [Entamoeba dispar SAW760]